MGNSQTNIHLVCQNKFNNCCNRVSYIKFYNEMRFISKIIVMRIIYKNAILKSMDLQYLIIQIFI